MRTFTAGPGPDHDDPLPDGLVVVGALAQLGRQRLAGDADVRVVLLVDRLDPAPGSRPRGRAPPAASGGSTSSGFIPVIFTKPPSGIQPIPYSVSPRLTLHSLRREEEEEALDAHAGPLRGDEVPELVQDDQQREPGEGEDPAHGVSAHATASPSIRPRGVLAGGGVGLEQLLEVAGGARSGPRPGSGRSPRRCR